MKEIWDGGSYKTRAYTHMWVLHVALCVIMMWEHMSKGWSCISASVDIHIIIFPPVIGISAFGSYDAPNIGIASICVSNENKCYREFITLSNKQMISSKHPEWACGWWNFQYSWFNRCQLSCYDCDKCTEFDLWLVSYEFIWLIWAQTRISTRQCSRRDCLIWMTIWYVLKDILTSGAFTSCNWSSLPEPLESSLNCARRVN